MSLAGLLNQSVTIKRTSRASDGQGGFTETHPSTTATIQARIRPASANEKLAGAQEQARVTHVLYCEADANIERADLIVDEDSLEYEVLSKRPPSVRDHHLAVDLEQIQKGV